MHPRMFAIAARTEVYTSALFRRVHDAEYYAIRGFCNARVIADVGANLGQSIASLARIFPAARFQAFEPNPVCERTIRTVAALARVDAKVHVCGLAGEAARLDFYLPVINETPLLQEGSFDPTVFDNPVTIARIGAPFTLDVFEIAVRRLDDFPDKYDVVKIDAQGFELPVLKGAVEILKEYSPLVFVENGPDTAAVGAYLKGFSYRNVTPAGMVLNSIFICD
jgi:FkbM family methyltransferase